jgi:FxsC-like protein
VSDARSAGERTRGSYFFLSYAHSPPLEGDQRADPDRYVRQFFGDLTAAVGGQASPQSGLVPGFFDQEIPVGSDWKKSLSRAIGAAEVFVPLYSPGYFARSWPGREWNCFYRRLELAGLQHPVRRFAPVLWTPLWDEDDLLQAEEDRLGFRAALEVGASEPEYGKNGLRALLRLTPYRGSYYAVVNQLAERIVTLAEGSPLDPSVVPDIDEMKSAFRPDVRLAVFTVAVAAPTSRTVPTGRDPGCYGEHSTQWRPFQPQEASLAEYAKRVAERLDFDVDLVGIEAADQIDTSRPGIILIDPWFIAGDNGVRTLRSAVSELPRWILPLLVFDSPDDARASALAQQVRDILSAAGALPTESSRRAARGVSSLEDFVAIVPVLVAEAERQYLRHGSGPGPRTRPGPRPRLGGAARPETPAQAPHRKGETPDDA